MALVDAGIQRLPTDFAHQDIGGVIAEIIRDDAALAALLPAWDRLLAADSRATVFHSPDWLVTWWRHHRAGRQLFVVALRRGDALVALAPLCLRRTGGPLRLSHLELLGTALTDVGGSLADPRVPWAGRALWTVIAAHRDEWDLVDLWHLPPQDPLIAEAGVGLPPGLRLRIDQQSVLSPLAVRSWQHQISGDILRNTRRRRRLIEQEGAVVLQVCRSGAEIAPALDELARLHAKRWALAGEVSTMRLGSYRAWLADAARALFDRGWLYLAVLRSGERAIAAGLYTLYRRRLVSYTYGFDPDLARYSPANLLTWEVLHDLEQNDLADVFDFGEGAEAYKARWTSRSEPLVRLSVDRQTPRSQVLRFLRLVAKPWLWRQTSLHQKVQAVTRLGRDLRERIERRYSGEDR